MQSVADRPDGDRLGVMRLDETRGVVKKLQRMCDVGFEILVPLPFVKRQQVVECRIHIRGRINLSALFKENARKRNGNFIGEREIMNRGIHRSEHLHDLLGNAGTGQFNPELHHGIVLGTLDAVFDARHRKIGVAALEQLPVEPSLAAHHIADEFKKGLYFYKNRK